MSKMKLIMERWKHTEKRIDEGLFDWFEKTTGQRGGEQDPGGLYPQAELDPETTAKAWRTAGAGAAQAPPTTEEQWRAAGAGAASRDDGGAEAWTFEEFMGEPVYDRDEGGSAMSWQEYATTGPGIGDPITEDPREPSWSPFAMSYEDPRFNPGAAHLPLPTDVHPLVRQLGGQEKQIVARPQPFARDDETAGPMTLPSGEEAGARTLELPQQMTPASEEDLVDNFDDAFALARRLKRVKFNYRDKPYTTQLDTENDLDWARNLGMSLWDLHSHTGKVKALGEFGSGPGLKWHHAQEPNPYAPGGYNRPGRTPEEMEREYEKEWLEWWERTQPADPDIMSESKKSRKKYILRLKR